MTFDLRLPRERQPEPAGRIMFNDDLGLMVIAWNTGRRSEALAMADANRAASTPSPAKPGERKDGQ